ncbi:hypothetical protein KEM52_005776, partial [Ascosphaera acerosa]
RSFSNLPSVSTASSGASLAASSTATSTSAASVSASTSTSTSISTSVSSSSIPVLLAATAPAASDLDDSFGSFDGDADADVNPGRRLSHRHADYASGNLRDASVGADKSARSLAAPSPSTARTGTLRTSTRSLRIGRSASAMRAPAAASTPHFGAGAVTTPARPPSQQQTAIPTGLGATRRAVSRAQSATRPRVRRQSQPAESLGSMHTQLQSRSVGAAAMTAMSPSATLTPTSLVTPTSVSPSPRGDSSSTITAASMTRGSLRGRGGGNSGGRADGTALPLRERRSASKIHVRNIFSEGCGSTSTNDDDDRGYDPAYADSHQPPADRRRSITRLPSAGSTAVEHTPTYTTITTVNHITSDKDASKTLRVNTRTRDPSRLSRAARNGEMTAPPLSPLRSGLMMRFSRQSVHAPASASASASASSPRRTQAVRQRDRSLARASPSSAASASAVKHQSQGESRSASSLATVPPSTSGSSSRSATPATRSAATPLRKSFGHPNLSISPPLPSTVHTQVQAYAHAPAHAASARQSPPTRRQSRVIRPSPSGVTSGVHAALAALDQAYQFSTAVAPDTDDAILGERTAHSRASRAVNLASAAASASEDYADVRSPLRNDHYLYRWVNNETTTSLQAPRSRSHSRSRTRSERPRAAPSLIASARPVASAPQVVKGMIFDPQRMCWVKLPTSRLSDSYARRDGLGYANGTGGAQEGGGGEGEDEDEDDDPFRDLPDLEDKPSRGRCESSNTNRAADDGQMGSSAVAIGSSSLVRTLSSNHDRDEDRLHGLHHEYKQKRDDDENYNDDNDDDDDEHTSDDDSDDWSNAIPEEFDVGPEFIRRQRLEEEKWRRKVRKWVGEERIADMAATGPDSWRWAVRSVVAVPDLAPADAGQQDADQMATQRLARPQSGAGTAVTAIAGPM